MPGVLFGKFPLRRLLNMRWLRSLFDRRSPLRGQPTYLSDIVPQHSISNFECKLSTTRPEARDYAPASTLLRTTGDPHYPRYTGSALRYRAMNHPSKVREVARVAFGNFLVMYDFTVFGYYAAAIGRAFFSP